MTTDLATPDFTDHVATCQGCDRKFRVNADFIAHTKDEAARLFGERITDEGAAASCEYCLECVSGETYPSEKDLPYTETTTTRKLLTLRTEFWVIKDPTELSVLEDIFWKTKLKEFANAVRGGLDVSKENVTIYAYADQDAAVDDALDRLDR